MAGKVSKFFERLYAGAEKDEGYARSTLPSSRWEQFWDIFKGRYAKLLLINLLVILCFIPLIILIYFRYVVMANYGSIYPFFQGFGVGYQAPVSMMGFKEGIAINTNILVFAFLPLVSVFVAIGFAGGAYIIRNMVWMEGYFVLGDFFKGIKQNFKQVVLSLVLYSFVLYTLILSISLVDQYIAVDTSMKWLFVIIKLAAYAIIVFISIVLMHMIELSVNYKYKFLHLIKNAFVFTVGSFVPSSIFLAIGLVPFIFMFIGSSWFLLGLLVILFLGFSFLMLVWTLFSQWLYDRYINPRMKNTKVNRGIYEKVKNNKDEALRKYKSQMQTAIIHTSLNAKPIKPITDEEVTLSELPTMFNRQDIEKLNESKQEIYQAQQRYVEEHKHDDKYKFNQEDQKREDERLAREKRIEQAKRQLAKREKNKK